MSKITAILIVLLYIKTEAQTSVLMQGDSLFALGNYTKAITVYKSGLDKKERYFNIAKCYTAIGNYKQALEYYKKTLQHYPDKQLVVYEYAKLLSKTKKYNEALKRFNSLIKIDSTNPNFHYQKALILEQQGDTLALQAFNKVLKLDVTHQNAIFKLTKYAVKKRQYQKAERLISKGLKNYPENIKLISLKAQNFFNQKNYHDATIWFNKLIELGESSKFIHERLSFCYNYKFKYSKAIEHTKKALELDKTDAQNIYNLGKLYSLNNDFKNAEKYLNLYLKTVDKPLDEQYIMLARTYNRQEKYKEAIDAYKIALKENPQNPMVPFYVLNTKLKYYADNKAKLEEIEKFLKRYPKSPYKLFVEEIKEKLIKEEFYKGE